MQSGMRFIRSVLGQEVLTVFKKDESTMRMFSVLKVIELIHKTHPALTVINLGETDFVVHYQPPNKKSRIFEYLKTALVCLTMFFGAAFTIITWYYTSRNNN